MKIDLNQLEFINPILREMAISVEENFGVEFCVTSLYRIDDPGVHGTLPLRGLDLRCHDPFTGEAVETYVNAIYEYDPDRPSKKCCMYHDAGQGGFHLHLQVHPKTVLK